MGLIAKKSGSSFELAPEGQHVARCYAVIDLGTQADTFEGETSYKQKIQINWELLGDERMKDGKPFSISARYANTLHERAKLRLILQQWRGRPFTEDEAMSFDLSKLVGQYCIASVVHNTNPKTGRTFANVQTLMPLMKGMAKPEAYNEAFFFDLDDPDPAIFDTFSDALKATIASAPEWRGAPVAVAGAESAPGKFASDDVPF